MTAETIHTCSYSCERPECIRAQRDELAARLTAETSNARGEVVAWFPTNAQGEIIRNYGDGSPVYACRTKEEAEQARRCHLGATGPVIPLYAAPPPAAVDGPCRLVDDVVTVNGIALDEVVRLGDRYAATIEKRGMPRAAQVFEALVLIGKHALATQHQEPTT